MESVELRSGLEDLSALFSLRPVESAAVRRYGHGVYAGVRPDLRRAIDGSASSGSTRLHPKLRIPDPGSRLCSDSQ